LRSLRNAIYIIFVKPAKEEERFLTDFADNADWCENWDWGSGCRNTFSLGKA
jgi:hypothetical protein